MFLFCLLVFESPKYLTPSLNKSENSEFCTVMAKRKIDRRLDSYQTKENTGNQIEILWTVKMHEVNRVIELSGL